jgi:hypothetical protein
VGEGAFHAWPIGRKSTMHIIVGIVDRVDENS